MTGNLIMKNSGLLLFAQNIENKSISTIIIALLTTRRMATQHQHQLATATVARAETSVWPTVTALTQTSALQSAAAPWNPGPGLGNTSPCARMMTCKGIMDTLSRWNQEQAGGERGFSGSLGREFIRLYPKAKSNLRNFCFCRNQHFLELLPVPLELTNNSIEWIDNLENLKWVK